MFAPSALNKFVLTNLQTLEAPAIGTAQEQNVFVFFALFLLVFPKLSTRFELIY